MDRSSWTLAFSFRCVVALVTLWVFGGTLPARAQSREQAREAYRKAAQAYDFGEYDKALTSFKEAYQQVEDPAILFNIAQCHRQLGHKQEAVRVYRSLPPSRTERAQPE